MSDFYGYADEQELDMPPEKEDVLETLERLKETVENAKGVLLSHNCLLNREQILHDLGTITYNLPDEMKHAKRIIANARQVELLAQNQAENLLAEARVRATQMIDEHDIARQAQLLADQIIRDAQAQADAIYQSACEYANNKLEAVEERLTSVLVEIRKDRQQN